MKYLVTVQRDICHTGVIEVEADSTEEARAKAKQEAAYHVLPNKYPTGYQVLRVEEKR